MPKESHSSKDKEQPPKPREMTIEEIQDIVATRLAEIIWMQNFDPRYRQDKKEDKPSTPEGEVGKGKDV